MPRAGTTVSADGHTAVVMAGAGADSNEMVRAADDLEEPLARRGGEDVQVTLTGASSMWSDFNQANREAMLKSELVSWPVTLAILVIAFGSLVAAGLPLLLTILGLVASAGSLYLLTLLTPVSIWAMNFALMFALALGIDYALFVVYRFRGALFGSGLTVDEAIERTMDTAGKAVLFSGVTVLFSLSSVMLVNSPAFRSMAVGIMLSVIFVLAATLTLLPAVLARLGPRIDRLSLPWVHSGEHRSARMAAWGERLWRRPWLPGIAAAVVLVVLALPVLSLDTGMPSIKVVPKGDSSRRGLRAGAGSLRPGRTGRAPDRDPGGSGRCRAVRARRRPRLRSGDATAHGDVRPARADPGRPRGGPVFGAPWAARSTACAQRCRQGCSSVGPWRRTTTSKAELAGKTPLVIGMVLALGFLLLLVALQAPLAALIGTVTNLLATGAAFGVAKLLFQDGIGAGVLGFESQGFLDAWGPVFFFAMIFAISMDYTVFLLSSAREHWERGEGSRAAMVGGLAHSGRVILAAAAVMVAVFFTFALSGPLPPKEMGIILGIAVLLDALLVRLLLVPVLLRLAGSAAWWLPRPLARVLPAVRFGH